MVMMKVSKYLCWVILKAAHLHFHHSCPNLVFSMVTQHLHFLLNIAQKQSSGSSANSTSTSLISGSPSASTLFKLCVSLSSESVEPSLSENVLFRSFSEARLGVRVEGSDNFKTKDERMWMYGCLAINYIVPSCNHVHQSKVFYVIICRFKLVISGPSRRILLIL